MEGDTLIVDLARGWDILLRAGEPFVPLDLVPFVQQAEFNHDDKHARWYVSRMYAEAGMQYEGGSVEPSAFHRTRVPLAFALAESPFQDVDIRLLNPPHPRDDHGQAVARAAAYILKDRRNQEAAFWTLEAARSLVAMPFGLQVKYVLEWQVEGNDAAQLLLLEDVEAFLRKTFDPGFKVRPVKALSAQAKLWGVGARRDFQPGLRRRNAT